MAACILCEANAIANKQENASRTIYSCPNCGVYVVSDVVMDDVLEHAYKIASYMMHRKLSGQEHPVLISYNKTKKDKEYLQLTVEQIVSRFPNSFSKRVDMALDNLGKMSQYGGEEIRISSLEQGPWFYIAKPDLEALSYIITSMHKAELIDVTYYNSMFFPCSVVVSPKGWERIEVMERGENGQKNHACLVFSRLEEPWSVAMRIAARKVLDDCGFDSAESWTVNADNVVDFALITQIKRSSLVICDLTDGSGETYYAAGLARALGKVTILMCNAAEKAKLRVNANHLHVILWKDNRDLYTELYNMIRALTD